MNTLQPQTPVGSHVTVNLVVNNVVPVRISGQVTQAGVTSAGTTIFGPAPPPQFRLAPPPFDFYFDLITTAQFTGAIEVCADYHHVIGDTTLLGLFHFEHGQWFDRTASLDRVNGIVCGFVSSFSYFAIFEQVAAGKQLTALSPAQVWIGLKNNDAVGLRLDLRAEVLLNGTTIGAGQLPNVSSGSSGFNNAKLNTIPLTLTAPVEVPANAALKITVSVRRTCSGGGHNSGTPQLWFNDSQANSRFGTMIGETASNLFLRSGFALATTPGSGPKQTIDVPVDNKTSCPNRPFKPFGSWSLTLP